MHPALWVHLACKALYQVLWAFIYFSGEQNPDMAASASNMTLVERIRALEAEDAAIAAADPVIYMPAPAPATETPKEDVRSQMRKELEAHLPSFVPSSAQPAPRTASSKSNPTTSTSMATPEDTRTRGGKDLTEQLKNDWLDWSCGIFDQAVENLVSTSQDLAEQVKTSRSDEQEAVQKLLNNYAELTSPFRTAQFHSTENGSRLAQYPLPPPVDLHAAAERFHKILAAGKEELSGLWKDRMREYEAAEKIMKKLTAEEVTQGIRDSISEFDAYVEKELEAFRKFEEENKAEMDAHEEEAAEMMEQECVAIMRRM